MSVSVQQVIQDALSGIGAYGVADLQNPDDAQLCLRRLQRMLDSWSNERQLIAIIPIETFFTVVGTVAYSSTGFSGSTLGRPVGIDSIYLRLNGVDEDVEFLDSQSYGEIAVKTARGRPQYCFVDAEASELVLKFAPAPDAVYTAFVSVIRPLASALTLTTTLTMPQGYEKAIVDNLAVDIAPSFGRIQEGLAMVPQADEARKAIKRTNYQPSIMHTGLPTRPQWRGRSSIIEGG